MIMYNIMYLVPKKEHHHSKLPKNVQRGLAQSSKVGPTYIGQLNQTKIEDGCLQKIINTCDRVSNELENVDTQPE